MSNKPVSPLKLNRTTKLIVTLSVILLILVITFSLVACNPAIRPTTAQKITPNTENTIMEQPDASSCEVLGLAISPTAVEVGQPVTIMADIINSGNKDEIYTAELRINDNVEVTRDLVIPGGATQRVNFLVSKDRPGNYLVTFGNLAGDFAILSKVASLQTDDNSQPGAAIPSCCDPNQANGSSPSCCGTSQVQQYSTQAGSVRSGGSCCGN